MAVAAEIADAPRPAADPGHAVPCDLCGSTRTRSTLRTTDRRFGLGGHFEVVRCVPCGLLRTSPQPSDPGAYYPTGAYYSYQPPAPPSAAARRRVRTTYGLPAAAAGRGAPRWIDRRLTAGVPPGPVGKIVDVGCGSGAFLLLLKEAGWDCHGVEFDPVAVDAAHTAGLSNVRAGDLTTAGYGDGEFDAVRYWHVLEHVSSPRAQLTEARRILAPGGTLTIGVPNAASLLARTARSRWYYLDVPRHLWHFDRPRLARLVEECGFRIERLELVSGSSPVLGTFGYLCGLGERPVAHRAAWRAALPVAAALDRIGLGDAIELVARAA